MTAVSSALVMVAATSAAIAAPTMGAPVFTPTSGVTYQHVDGPTLWFNPSHAGAVTVTVTPVDAAAGIDHVEFPNVADLPGATVSASPWSTTYAWASGFAGASDETITAVSGDTSTASIVIHMRPDGSLPAAATISVPASTGTAQVLVNGEVGADADSGIGAVAIQRSSASQRPDGTCATFGGWGTVKTLVAASGPITQWGDTRTNDTTCYRYRLVVSDAVGNQVISEPQTTIIDRIAPTADFTWPPTGVAANGVVTLTGTAADAAPGSGVVSAHVTTDTGDACTSLVAADGTWTCTWDVAATQTPVGTRQLTVVSHDAAGNESAPTSAAVNVVAAADAPTAIINQPIDGAEFGGDFQLSASVASGANSTWALASFAFELVSPSGDVLIPCEPRLRNRTATPTCYWSPTGFPSGNWGIRARVSDAGGVTHTTQPIAVYIDVSGPSGVQVGALDDGLGRVTVATASGVDHSGTATTTLERDDGAVVNGACVMNGAWASVALDASGTTSDGPFADAACVQYRLTSSDVYGWSTTAETDPLVIDAAPPAVTFDTATVTTTQPAIVTLSGAAADSVSTVGNVDVTYAGPSAGSACTTAAVAGAWSCAFDARLLAPGTYTLTATVHDDASHPHVASTTRTLIVQQPASGGTGGGGTGSGGGTTTPPVTPPPAAPPAPSAPVPTPLPAAPPPATTPVQPVAPAGFRITSGADTITGTAGADVIDAKGGNDTVFGMAGNDALAGGAGNDRILGGKGNDRIFGGLGNDVLDGGPGTDTIDGGAGADIITTRDKTRDIVTCGAGRDTVTADKVDKVAKDCEKVTRK